MGRFSRETLFEIITGPLEAVLKVSITEGRFFCDAYA
jgi:hypothetical protein